MDMKLNRRLASFVSAVQSIGEDSLDDQEQRLHKRIFVSALFLMMIATIVWGITYLLVGETLVAMISLAYSVYNLVCLGVISRCKKFQALLVSQLILGLVLPSTHSYLLGGFAASSAVVLWSVISALAALIYLKPGHATLWAVVFLTMLSISGLLQPLNGRQDSLPESLVTISFVLNIGGVSVVMLIIVNYFQQQKNETYQLLRQEQEKTESLLLNILPKEIAAILKSGNQTIAEHFKEASILFADLVGFTSLTARLAPEEMVNLLNLIFSTFDGLVEKYDLEKIRTIGDNYMVVSGVPRPRPDHAQALARMALEMQQFILNLPPVDGKPILFRIGLNSGPLVGGVIGRKKFVYDVWGDAVNVASRMESQGVAGKIQISDHTRALICGEFDCEPRGIVELKGRGAVTTWFLVGAKHNFSGQGSLPPKS